MPCAHEGAAPPIVAKASSARDAADMWSWAPGLELASIRHAGLDARLFRS